MRKFTWLNHLLVYFMWAIVLLLGIWFLLLSRDTVSSALTLLYVKDSLTRAGQVRFLDKFYVLGVGLLWLVMMIFSEFYFRAAVHHIRLLFRRFALILGIELLLLFVADGGLLLAQGLGIATWSRWLILAGELGVSIVCFISVRSIPPKPSEPPIQTDN